MAQTSFLEAPPFRLVSEFVSPVTLSYSEVISLIEPEQLHGNLILE